MFVYYNGAESLNEITLTFDDGPNPPRTEKVLDVLDSFKIKATFFIIGKWADKFPQTVKEIKARGHLIGNQSYSHSRDVDDIKKCEDSIKRITGETALFIRPPWGEWKNYPSLNGMKDKKIIILSFHTFDWQNPGVDKIVEYYLKNIKNGSIITLHDGDHKESNSNRSDQMIQALPKILEKLNRFKFVRLDEMKLVPKEVD